MDLLKDFSFLAFLAPIILFYQQSKNFLLKIFRVFWKERIVAYDFAYDFYHNLSKKSFVINFDDYSLKRERYFSLSRKKFVSVLIKLFKFEIMLYRYCVPILIFPCNNEDIKIQYLKFTFDFEKFLSKIIIKKYDITIKENRFHINKVRGKSIKKIQSLSIGQSESPSSIVPVHADYIFEPYIVINNKLNRTLGIDVNDLDYSEPVNNTNKYVFTEDGKKVLSYVEKWLNAESWYQSKGIRYYRGLLMNGSVGTGKSSLVLQIARKLGIPIYIFDLSSFDNEEFEKEIEDLPYASGIILFEDIDNLWDGRVNITKNSQFGGLTFDCFINQLSGVDGIKNKFVVITTNHSEKLDPALIRSGRIDYKVELQPLTLEVKREMAKIVLENDELVQKVLDKSNGLSAAEFENLVVQTALDTFWS